MRPRRLLESHLKEIVNAIILLKEIHFHTPITLWFPEPGLKADLTSLQKHRKIKSKKGLCLC